MKTQREKKIELFLNQLDSQKEWEYKQNTLIQKLNIKYSSELEDYLYINNVKHIKKGGYIRYINFDNDFRWGGIVVKKYKLNNLNLIIIKNITNKYLTISFEKNLIFFKNHTTQADKNKKIFLSYLDKYE